MKTIGAGIGASVAFSGSAGANRGGLKRELAEVRSATAEYDDPANAVEDGYVPEDDAVCGMGYHYPNFNRIGTVDRTQPQVLVYGEGDDGVLVLGAVEYLVPRIGDYTEEPPDLFSHDEGSEEWAAFGHMGWALHVWVHNTNPAGVFNPTNPRELFCPDGSGEH